MCPPAVPTPLPLPSRSRSRSRSPPAPVPSHLLAALGRRGPGQRAGPRRAGARHRGAAEPPAGLPRPAGVRVPSRAGTAAQGQGGPGRAGPGERRPGPGVPPPGATAHMAVTWRPPAPAAGTTRARPAPPREPGESPGHGAAGQEPPENPPGEPQPRGPAGFDAPPGGPARCFACRNKPRAVSPLSSCPGSRPCPPVSAPLTSGRSCPPRSCDIGSLQRRRLLMGNSQLSPGSLGVWTHIRAGIKRFSLSLLTLFLQIIRKCDRLLVKAKPDKDCWKYSCCRQKSFCSTILSRVFFCRLHTVSLPLGTPSLHFNCTLVLALCFERGCLH